MDEKRNRENGDDLETKYLCINNNDSCIQYFYDIWVGDSVKISLSLSVMVGVYILVQNLCGIYIYMINGTSKIRLQLVVYLVSAFISVPTMYFLCSKYGITVMLLVPISVCLIQAFVAKKQLTKIIRGTASGIWIK